ncbi:MAG: flagellar biosynthesis anti-sigma factor FlgM [Firmicutes bacterium]|mgnify:CR=1 FL=1|jgi:anti-sigma28 factor (negative regulator of flagellin synthesis)|nr:flagellar biosynthesis anti-sigma factor FlgM [Bacillota bacterium]
MKIQGYRSILEQLLKFESRTKDIPARAGRAVPGEKTEISDAVDVLQRELEKTEREEDMERAVRLESIAESLNNGTYKVDTSKLAESMLDA